MTRVAVVGLGAMGSRIAQRLLDAGNEVVVWNRDPSKAEPLAAAGAIVADTPADAARRADAVLTMVADPAALSAVTEGADGVATGADERTVIQMSTVDPAAVTRLASVLPRSADLLDAPVLGSLSEVEAGTLTIFAGGEPHVVARWTPLLSALGSVLPVGGVGAGTAAKLVANTTLLGVLTLLGEAIALGERLGLRRETVFDVLAKTPLAAQAERRRPAIESGDYALRFALSLARKDNDLITRAAAAHGLDLPLAAAVGRWFADAERAGMAGADYSAVIAYIVGDRRGDE